MKGQQLESELFSPCVNDFPQHLEALQAGPTHARTYDGARAVVIAGLNFIEKYSRIEKWKSGKVIYGQGYPASRIFMMRSGFAYLSTADEEGGEQIAEVIGFPTIVGGDAFHGSRAYEHSLLALGDCTASSFSLARLYAVGDFSVVDFFFADHAVHAHNLSAFLDRFKLGSTVAMRLALILLDLKARREPFPFEKLTQQQLAGLTRSTRESVSKSIGAFRRAGIADVGRNARRIDLNEEKLRKIASEGG